MAKDDPLTAPADFASAADRAGFERFTAHLVGLARAHLDPRFQHKVDPEDVVQSAYKSFCRRYGEGELAQQGINNLWSLLSLITLRKCADRVRYHKAECRDLEREAGTGEADAPAPWQGALGREPTPEHAAVLSETVEQILLELKEDERGVFELCLQGYSTQEVSQRLGRPERSVRRLRERLRKRLEQLQNS